ncbi:MAG: DNA-processing protein DprA [Alphaproteobacteria bacterium]
MNAAPHPLSPAEKLDWLRLIRSENVGPITFHRLMEHFGSAAAALKALPEVARRGGRGKPITLCAKGVAEREMEAALAVGAEVIARCEPAYPRYLAAIEDAPPLLFVRGSPHLLQRPMVAIVGARNASLNGRKLARQFALGLTQGSFVVASGLARGIDTAAHEGALAGGTVAVNAGGVDTIYPPENAKLYEAIVGAGAVVSETPMGEEPQARHFPRRNRIISGLALGVVVVEATTRSGSLITARMALEQGREVFAIPGSPLDPRAEGPNRLIRQGATLVERADDVLNDLADLLRRPLSEPPARDFGGRPPPAAEVDSGAALDRAREEVLGSLGPTPVTVDEIIRQCQLSPPMVSQILLELELAGRIERHPGNQVSVIA